MRQGGHNPTYDRVYFTSVYRDYQLQNPPRKIKYYQRWSEYALANRTKPRILDLGCAFGDFLRAVDPGWDRCGVDSSSYAINKAKKLDRGVNYYVSDLPNIPVQRRFHLITAFDTLEHVVDLELMKQNIIDHLVPDGMFLFVVPVYDSATGPAVRLLDRDSTHVHKKGRFFWLEWASAHFQIIRWEGIFRWLFPWGYYLHCPTHTLRWMTPAIIVLARRTSK